LLFKTGYATMQIIDTHTHIYLDEFTDDRSAMLDRAKAAGVGALLLPAIDSSTHASMLALEETEASCHAMIGLHPCSAKENVEEELSLIASYLGRRSFVAIGETGLDFYWDKTFLKEQYRAFHQQIEWAMEKDLPIVIHSREATDACIEVVQGYPGLRGVFHCFSGTPQHAGAVRETGLLLGIGGVVTFKNAGLDKVIEARGLDGVVLETDAPYLAPVPYRGKRNEPSYLPLVVDKLAALTRLPPAEVIKITSENAKNLFMLRQ